MTATLYGVIISAVSVFSDLYVIVIPLPVIWQLHMARRKKIGVSVIFITGLLQVSHSMWLDFGC